MFFSSLSLKTGDGERLATEQIFAQIIIKKKKINFRPKLLLKRKTCCFPVVKAPLSQKHRLGSQQCIIKIIQ